MNCEDLIEVMRDIMISNLENERTDIQYKIHIGEIQDGAHIESYVNQINQKIERLKKAYNPYKKNEY